ncbi:MAG: hypothetical protein GY809_16490 [Planctomycetes bacterium]|nr:hypothetical protein [Planctomycetota bacterium]
MFATRENKKLPQFVSPAPDDQAMAYDTFTMPWTGRQMYMFPPWAVLSKVLAKLHQEPAEAILIAPKWPAQPWYPMLLSMSVATPVELPTREGLLRQGLFTHQALHILQLHAWRLSSRR